MAENTGGAAFPRPLGHNGLKHHEEHEASDAQDGMTLRDYFAAKSMQGMLASGGDHYDGQGDPERFAKNAYAYADAMLAERVK